MSYQTLLDAVIKGDIKTAKEETLRLLMPAKMPRTFLIRVS